MIPIHSPGPLVCNRFPWVVGPQGLQISPESWGLPSLPEILFHPAGKKHRKMSR